MTEFSGTTAQPERVGFDVEGTRCVGDLWKPHGNGPFPVVLLASGLGGVRAMRLDAFAQRFAAAGYAALTFDYRGFGDSEGQPRQVLDIGRQRDDWRGAIDFVCTRPDLAPSAIVLWGTSFSGGHVLTLASERNDIAAVIAQCPFTDGIASSMTLGPVSTIKVGAAALFDLTVGNLRRRPLLIESAGPRGSRSLMTSPDALPGVQHLVDAASGDPDTRVAARIGLMIGLDRPGKHLSKISAPTLVQVCRPDTVAPDAATMHHLDRAANPRITVDTIEAGHFEIYLGQPFERTVSVQIEFLAEHVPATVT